MSKRKVKPNQEQSQSGPSPAQGAAADQATLEALRERAAEADQLREHLLRARADYANLQKRHLRDMEAFRRYALHEFVASLLPGLDDVERALTSAAETPDADALRAGVQMALDALHKALREAGVEPVATDGAPFDPAVHDALVVETADDVDTPTVAEEIRPGYTLGDRLVRPAQVKVAMPPQPVEADATADDPPHADPPEGKSDADV